MTSRSWFLFALLILLISPACELSAQRSIEQHPANILKALDAQAQFGQVRALRDMGSMLNRPEIRLMVIERLRRRCLFTSKEFDLQSDFGKQAFLDFYYEHADSLQYSELLQAFYLTPLYSQDIKFEIRQHNLDHIPDRNPQLREQVDEAYSLLQKGRAEALLPVLENIIRFDQEESYKFLLEILENKKFRKLKGAERNVCYQMVARALVRYPKLESARALLTMVKQRMIEPAQAAKPLSFIINNNLTEDNAFSQLTVRAESLLDSLVTLESIRAHGYQKIFNFQPGFFRFEVDYFGKIINDADDYPWIQHNAMLDLARSEHPRALFYLATQLFKHRYDTGDFYREYREALSGEIQSLTRLDVQMMDSRGQLVNNPYLNEDEVAQKNMIVYWSKHYDDYEWDDNYLYFANKKRAEDITQNYQRLFRRLNSKNDSVAMQSFVQLTEGDVLKVIELAEKYRQLLRSYNNSLPSFKHQFLEQLVQLTDFCKRNQVRYKLSEKTQTVFEKLKGDLPPHDRHQFENELLKILSLNEVTALEYQSCINEGNTELGYSIGRILDQFYSRQWPMVLNSDAQLRLYLKKAALFEGIGVFGSCNSYLIKFNVNDAELQARLNRLGRVESDEDILNQISQLVIEQDNTRGFSVEDFMASPQEFTRQDRKTLPAPTIQQVRKIVKTVRQSEDLGIIRHLLLYVRQHPDIEQVPHLFSLIDDDRILSRKGDLTITVADFCVPIIENIYQHKFPSPSEEQPFDTEAWRERWEADGRNYQDWSSQFYEERLEKLARQDEIQIEKLNDAVASPYYEEIYKDQFLAMLKKVQPIGDIKRLNLQHKLSVQDDLSHLQAFYFNYKDLDDIPKLFEITDKDVPAMMEFLWSRAEKYSVSERGSFFNNLFRTSWWTHYLNSPEVDMGIVQKMKVTLEDYLFESEYLSEYEEQAINLHVAQIDNIGKSVIEKLEASLNLNIDQGSKATIQQSIIATLRFDQLDEVAPYFMQLSPGNGQSSFAFLQSDFGLPIYDLDDPEQVNEFIQLHQTLSEEKFYEHYLRAFGVDFQDRNGQLDFQKVYDILQFDIVTPFVSHTGSRRDYFTYGVIKLLEFHFNDRLGFHPKLNENQSFYTYSATKRAAAWSRFLEKQGVVKAKYQLPASFSHSRSE